MSVSKVNSHRNANSFTITDLPQTIDLNDPALQKNLKELSTSKNNILEGVKKCDANNDGKISGDERKALFEYIDTFDKNGHKNSIARDQKGGQIIKAFRSSSYRKIQQKQSIQANFISKFRGKFPQTTLQLAFQLIQSSSQQKLINNLMETPAFRALSPQLQQQALMAASLRGKIVLDILKSNQFAKLTPDKKTIFLQQLFGSSYFASGTVGMIFDNFKEIEKYQKILIGQVKLLKLYANGFHKNADLSTAVPSKIAEILKENPNILLTFSSKDRKILLRSLMLGLEQVRRRARHAGKDFQKMPLYKEIFSALKTLKQDNPFVYKREMTAILAEMGDKKAQSELKKTIPSNVWPSAIALGLNEIKKFNIKNIPFGNFVQLAFMACFFANDMKSSGLSKAAMKAYLGIIEMGVGNIAGLSFWPALAASLAVEGVEAYSHHLKQKNILETTQQVLSNPAVQP